MSIRNIAIIAHIDHGKSTLADRLIELTQTVPTRQMKEQLLDQMDLERERGITIKLQPVTLNWQGVMINLIDTPGHVDFSYEVSRSLAAVEGVILLVDATQGIQAQTLTNLHLALEQKLKIIPVINKIDLPAADVESTIQALSQLIGCSASDVISISAKTGANVPKLLEAIVERIPPPAAGSSSPCALIFDAKYDDYQGVIIYIRVLSGTFRTGQHLKFLSNNKLSEVKSTGIFKPQMQPIAELGPGSIGYLVTNIKSIGDSKVGDTVALASDMSAKPLAGYRDIQPMVYASLYPEEGQDVNKLRRALGQLKLNDSSLVYEPESSPVLGYGFRCGFLGLLHLEIVQERLRREYRLPTVVTTPSVAYQVLLRNNKLEIITSPLDLPDENQIAVIEEPMVIINLLSPKKYLGPLMSYLGNLEANLIDNRFLDQNRSLLTYRLPLADILTDFYDNIKNISSGYASYNYELDGYQACDVIKLDILVAEQKVAALTTLVKRHRADSVGRRIVSTLKDLLPRQQFVLKIQAAIGGKIIAAERLSALRKDVTAKLYGGDVTRKRKLLEKQKKGKKRMMSVGRVEIPTKAYLAVLKK